MTTSPRTELASLEGRTITGEATLTHQWRRLKDGSCWVLAQNIYVFPHVTVHHAWMPAWIKKQVQPDERFSFRARVERYTRSDGSKDLGLEDVKVLGRKG